MSSAQCGDWFYFWCESRAGSEEAHAAFVEKLFHHVVKQPVRAYGPNTLPELVRSFEANEFNIRKLMVEIVARTAVKR